MFVPKKTDAALDAEVRCERAEGDGEDHARIEVVGDEREHDDERPEETQVPDVLDVAGVGAEEQRAEKKDVVVDE